MDECSAPLHEELQGNSPEDIQRINRVHVRDGVEQETTEENTEFKESLGGICVVERELGQKKMKEVKSNYTSSGSLQVKQTPPALQPVLCFQRQFQLRHWCCWWNVDRPSQ